jgi:hypothetical protein
MALLSSRGQAIGPAVPASTRWSPSTSSLRSLGPDRSFTGTSRKHGRAGAAAAAIGWRLLSCGRAERFTRPGALSIVGLVADVL